MIQLLLLLSQIQLVAKEFEPEEAQKALLGCVVRAGLGPLDNLPAYNDINSERRIDLDVGLFNVGQVVRFQFHQRLVVGIELQRLLGFVAFFLRVDYDFLPFLLVRVPDHRHEVADVVLLVEIPETLAPYNLN